MARVDDAELTIATLPTVGFMASWRAVGFDARIWDDEAVVHDLASGSIHLIAAETGRLLQRIAGHHGPAVLADLAAAPSHDLLERLHELERIGLIRRDTPAA